MVEKMCPSEIVEGNKFIKNWPLIFWNGAVYGHFVVNKRRSGCRGLLRVTRP